MQGYNCIMVYNQDESKLLFCRRTKDPYKGLYNLVGGKIENGEGGFEAAYRELEEETGISNQNIQLYHMMDFTYYNQDCYVEVYSGVVNSEVTLIEEEHPLSWIDITEDFFALDKFAGEGNIGHMLEQVKCFGKGLPEVKKQRRLDINSICIGIDGCKGGWIGAIVDHGNLIINKFNSLNSIIEAHSNFDEFLIDMVIGLPSNQKHIRPDSFARKIIKERASTIFPAPCRQAVYAETVSLAYEENERVLGKKITPLTVGIIPKMREVDMFLQENPQYTNVIKESHPEVCFAMLNGKTVISKKSDIDGMIERIGILRAYLPHISLEKIAQESKKYKCNVDDIIDAICLAVTGNIVFQNKYQIIPDKPMKDELGLMMQMIVPKSQVLKTERKMSLGKTTEMNTYIGCSIIIHDNEDNVLIAQRSKSKNSFPLLWETVGGALENDETPEECIRREVKEELNCNILDLKLFNIYIINEDNRYVLIVYTGKINEPIQHNSEIEQIRWVDKYEIEKFDFYGNELEKLLDYYTNE